LARRRVRAAQALRLSSEPNSFAMETGPSA
jgi:hypothetical protein